MSEFTRLYPIMSISRDNGVFRTFMRSQARSLVSCLSFPLLSYLVNTSSEGSGETAQLRRLALAFSGCDAITRTLTQIYVFPTQILLSINVILITRTQYIPGPS